MRQFIVAWSDHGCLTALAWVKWLKAKVIRLRVESSRLECQSRQSLPSRASPACGQE